MPFRRTHKFLLGAGATGAAAVVAVTAVWITYRADMARKVLADQVREIVGRELVSKGEAEVRLLPRPMLKLRDVALSTEAGEAEPPLTADEMQVSLRLLPLIAGRFVLKNFVLTRPTVHIRIDSTGRPNWRLPAIEARRDSERLGNFWVADGTITYEDARFGLSEKLDHVDAALSWPSLVEPVSLAARAEWRAASFDVTATAEAPWALIAGQRSPVRLTIASPLLKASINGRAGLLPRADLDGEAAITTPAARELLRWSGHDLGPGSSLGAASIRGRLKLDSGRAQMDAAPLEIDGNRAEGALQLAFSGPRPRVTGTLDFERLDLSPYVVPVEGGAHDFDPALLSRLDADLRLSAGSVLIGRFGLGQLAASAVLRDNFLEAMVGDAEFYGGRIKGSVSIAPWQDGIRGRAKGMLTRVDAQRALAALGGVARLSGQGDASFALGGEGSTWRELLRTLDGHAELKLRQGSIAGLPMPQARELPGGRLVLALAPLTAASFDTLEASVTFADGEAHADRLLVDGAGLHLSGHGTISLPSLALALHGHATMSRKGSAGEMLPGFDIPLVVAGTLGQPLLMTEESEVAAPAGELPSFGDVIRALSPRMHDATAVSPE